GRWPRWEARLEEDVTATGYPDGFNRTFYTYKGGRFDVRGRGWLGFAATTATDEQTGATTTTEFDNVTRSNTGAASAYRYPGAFRPARKTIQVDERLPGEQTGKIWRSTASHEYLDELVQGSSPPAARSPP